MTVSTSHYVAVNLGSGPNTGTGDDLLTAFNKINQNFANYEAVGIPTQNISASGTVEAAYFKGDGSQLTGIAASYSNVNAKTYLAAFDGNIIPSANVTYSLGSNDHRWKDLYLSGNTIVLGDTAISTDGTRITALGASFSLPTGAVGFANVYQEVTTDFSTVYNYNTSPGHRYTANLTTYSSAPIIWDELRTVKFINNTESLDTLGGRFANATAALDSTGNVAGITISDGGIGYDAYYPFYATDPTGYNNGQFPWGGIYSNQSYYKRIGLIPTSAADIGNITSLASGFQSLPGVPTVGTNTYTWTGNTGSTISVTINWSANTVTGYTYTRALPALTSANDWQNWLLDYQANNVNGNYLGSGAPLGRDASYVVYDYLYQEALPSNLVYDITLGRWYPNGWNYPVGTRAELIAAGYTNSFSVNFNRTAIGYAQLQNNYSNYVYWLRGASIPDGATVMGTVRVTGDLAVTGSLYVSPTSIYMGNATIKAYPNGNLLLSNGITITGNLTSTGAQVERGYTQYKPTANIAVTGNVGTNRLLLHPTGTIVSFGANVTLPNTQADGTIYSISSNVTISSLDVRPSWNGVVAVSPNGNVTSITAGTVSRYMYIAADYTWYKIA
jgi:hypothetical protein